MGGSITKNKYTCCWQDKCMEKSQEKRKRKKNEEYDSNLAFIKKYKIMNKIGDGNFSKVFYCRGDNKKIFAMKLMCCSIKKTSHYNCFKRELYIMKTLNNNYPYIVKMLDYHEKIWKKYYILKLILEYCEGGSLFEFVKINGVCSHTDARVIIIRLTEALQYINSLKMMHRDIKPENILLRTKNNVRSVVLSDFGLAKIAMPNHTTIKSRSICGSDFYLAPEMIRNKEYGIKIDVWSLGVTVYFIVVGRVPFMGKNAHDLYNNILKANVHEVLSKEAAINNHPGLKNLLENMLVHDPEKRFSCADILRHRWIRGTLSSYEFRMFNSTSFIRKVMLEEKRRNALTNGVNKETNNLLCIKDKDADRNVNGNGVVVNKHKKENCKMKPIEDDKKNKNEKESYKKMKKKYNFFLKKLVK